MYHGSGTWYQDINNLISKTWHALSKDMEEVILFFEEIVQLLLHLFF
jgi:hypothetical protein